MLLATRDEKMMSDAIASGTYISSICHGYSSIFLSSLLICLEDMSFSQAELVDYLNDRNLITYLSLSSIVLYVYDWFLLLPAELEFVWSSKQLFTSPLNILYIVQRYMPLVDTLGLLPVVTLSVSVGPDTCRTVFVTTAWMYISGVAITEVVLTLRTWVLWRKDKRILIVMIIFFLCCWVPIIYFNNLFVRTHTYLASPSPEKTGCVIIGGTPVFFLCWVFLWIYEAGILILMLIPGFTFFRTNKSALLTVIYRDGITYYICLFAISVANVVIILSLPHDLENLFTPYQRVMHVLLTSRVILHMRSQSRKPQWPSQPIRGVAVYVSQEQIISRSVDDDEVELLPLSEARRVQSVDV